MAAFRRSRVAQGFDWCPGSGTLCVDAHRAPPTEGRRSLCGRDDRVFQGDRSSARRCLFVDRPNGTGKSTVLYALASVISGNRSELGRNLLAPRLRSHDAMVAFQTDGGLTFVTVDAEHPERNTFFPGPFDG